MNIQITTSQALAYIELANHVGATHSMVELKSFAKEPQTDHKYFLWEADAPSLKMEILLNADGTWVPKLLGVPSADNAQQAIGHDK